MNARDVAKKLTHHAAGVGHGARGYAIVGLVPKMIRVLLISVALSSCGGTVAAFPHLDSLAAKVASDLELGRSDADVTADACRALGGRTSADAACAKAEEAVDDVLSTLVDTGELSPLAIDGAAGWLERRAAKLEARAKREEMGEDP
jgi:hypothetical protein